MPNNEGYVYFIKARNGLVKIGRAKNVERRLMNLKIASPVSLKLVKAFWCGDSKMVESFFHRMFAHWRRHGEWFELPDMFLESIVESTDDELEDLVVNGKHSKRKVTGLGWQTSISKLKYTVDGVVSEL